VTRSVRVTSERPAWGFGSLVRRLVWLEIALIAVAAIRPGPLSAAAGGLALLVVAALLIEPVPDEIDFSVSTSGTRVTAGEVVRLDVAIAFGSGPAVPVTAMVLPAEGVETAGRQSWQPTAGGDPIRLLVRPRRWMRGPIGHLGCS
jgi:uncharacterized protein (DUF58 family)